MKKMSKRFLSVFLAAVMVFTTVPFTALTALAKNEEPASYAYLTDEASLNAFTKTGTVTWDSTENAAYFNGGYLQLTGFDAFSNVSSSTGFAVSFDFKKTSATGRYGFVFTLSNGASEADRFAFNAGSDTDSENWRRGITIGAVNNAYNWYYANDLDNSNHCNPAGTWWLPENDNWYNMTLYMAPNGGYTYFVNGENMGTFRSDYSNSSNGAIDNSVIENAISGFTQLNVGAGPLGGEIFKGYIKNVQFYSYAANDAAKCLKTAMDAYEAKMADGKLYKNLSNAYSAYQTASRLYDAYIYGEATPDSTFINAANDLALKTGAMQPWNKVTSFTSVVPSFSGDSSSYTSDYYGGLLYSPQASQQWTYGGTDSNNKKLLVRLYQSPNTVALFDGNTTIKIPVMFSGRRGNSNRYIYSFYPTNGTTGPNLTNNDNTEISFYQNWTGNNGGTEDFTWSIRQTNRKCGYSANNATASDNFNNSDTYRFYANVLRFNNNNVNFNGAAVKDYQITWQLYAGSNTTIVRDDIVFSGTSNAHIYLINYVGIENALYDALSYCETVANFKEGGLSSILSAMDSLTLDYTGMDWSSPATKIGSINSAYTALTGTTPATDSVYPDLRAAIDHNGAPTAQNPANVTSVLDAYSKKKNVSPYNGQNTGSIDKTTFADFVTAYETARSAMGALASVNSYQANYNNTAISTIASELVNKYNALTKVNVGVPGFSQGGDSAAAAQLIGPGNKSLTITNPEAEGKLAYTISYDNGADKTQSLSQATVGAGATFSDIFENRPDATTATIQAYIDIDGEEGATVTKYYKVFNAPVVANGQALNINEDAVVTTGNEGFNTIIEYTTDGENWNAAPCKPFGTGTASDATATVTFRENKNGVLSPTVSANFFRAGGGLVATAADYSVDAEKGADFYVDGENNAKFSIAGASSYNGDVYFKVSYNGETASAPQLYNKQNNYFTIAKDKSFVTVTAWADGATDQTTITTLYNSANYSPLAYRESFDGSVSGNTYTPAEGGSGISLTGSGTISVEKGAGTKTASGNESYSWRNNVLKINSNSSAPGPVVTAAQNPLSTSCNNGINASAAKAQGVTISFWRHMEDGSGNTVNKDWRDSIAFQENNDNTTYFMILDNGIATRRIDGDNYTDVVPENQDNTAHEMGATNGEWEHIAVTVNPTGGIHVYLNGVEHDYNYVKVYKNGSETLNAAKTYEEVGAVTAETAAEVIDFLTDPTTQFTFDNGCMHWGADYNLFLDDIRIYTKTLTQVEINNMYTDEYADVQTNITSTSHDPTTVTVYTLGEDVTTMNGTKAEGSKVGEEFIEYYNVPENKISQIEYYSFGTGMTVYKAGATEKTLTGDMQIQWNVLGDSEGRCGYQNQDLFGAEYTTALAPVITAAGFSADEQANGAGHLVWAPHVMYNLRLDKWVYYASMSSWGSLHSATFMCTSDDPIKNYTYNSLVYQSNSWTPNAIDMSAFYGRDTDGNIVPDELYMTMGSYNWDGRPNTTPNFGAIYGMEINPNGTAKYPAVDSMQSHGTQLSRAYMADLEGAPEGQGSCEGSFVQYINGYYYLFVSFGANEGSYTERVFRSTEPLGPYAGTNGVDSNTGEMIYKNRGNQILSPFDNSIYTKTYRSTGHNSVYKAKNNDGDWVYVNAVHARPYASKSHNWTAVQDNALAKRQSGGVTGNVSFNNMLGVTENGWLVMFPYQYNGMDSVYKEVKASKLEGLYYGNNMRLVVDSNWGTEYMYTILANLDDETDTTGVIFGVRGENDFRMKFKLVRDASGDKVQYIRIYDDSATYAQILANSVDPIHEGVIGIHNKSGVDVPMLATLNIDNTSDELGMQFWAYRMGNVPDVDKVISHGDLVSMDGVIYTHASDKEVLTTYGVNNGTDAQKELALKSGYSLYGQEISDNFEYGQKDANDQYTSGGERYTTLTTKFPAAVDMDKVGNIISLNDTEYCRSYGESGSNMRFVELHNGKWCTKNAQGVFVETAYAGDEEAAAAVEANPSLELYKVYGIVGKVSTFFRYYNHQTDGAGVMRDGYPKVGVTLVVSYVDVTDGTKYSEFEFCYVMPNPAWAHTLAATKNEHGNVGNNYNSSIGVFNRFENSYGEASDYSSSMLYYAARGRETGAGWGYGTSGYLTDFATHGFSDTDLDELSKIQTLMNFSPNKAAGVNSGSFSAAKHNNDNPNAYIATPQLINTQYYVDYSDKSNYIKNNPNTGLITTGSNNTTDTPTGYQFKMKTSNFLWANYENASIFDVTCYSMNTTGLNVTYSSTASSPYCNGKGNDGVASPGPGQMWNDEYLGNFSFYGIYDTNYPFFGSDVTLGGKKRWFDDAMLFHVDQRNSSNSLYTTNYRNKVLYYFSDRNASNMQYLKRDTAKQTKYPDGTSYNGTPSKVWNYYDYAGSKAYTTAANGKLSTNGWQGTATFTGKNRLEQNTTAKLEAIANESSSDSLVYSNGRLYDGYYYYHEVDSNSKEDWTSSYSTASSAGTEDTDWGKLDVTTENLANYILEMGNYHKISDTGVGGGRFLGNETYHYYNIGVATCDKGAARDFLENYGLKLLAYTEDSVTHKKTVTRDADTGRPTVTGDMNVEDISAASYRDYINAIARLEWFVKNPTNTLQNDLKSEDTYKNVEAIQNASAEEYTTAYSNGFAVYKQATSGSNIFQDGTTNTDAVQAQLIDDVIEAYENLYTVEDYKRVEQEYKATKEAIDDAIAAESGDYTQESIDNYTKDFEAIKLAVEYYTDITGVNKDEDIDSTLLDFDDDEYWRYSDYSGADYEKLRDAMKEIQKSLMPKVDVSILSTTATTQAGVVRDGIFDNNVQVKNYADWTDLYGAVCNADGSQFNTADGTVQTEHPKAMFDITGGEVKSLNEVLDVKRVENDPSTHLDYVLYPTVSSVEAAHAATYYDNTAPSADVYVGVDFDKDGTVDEYAKISAEQKGVNAENYELSQKTVRAVDSASAYTAYNSAYNVVANSVNREKYTAEGRAILDNALSTKYNDVANLHRVYVKATADDVALYTAVMGSSPFGVNTDLKVTSEGETDPNTAYLLTQSNLLESKVGDAYPYIRQFTVKFDVTGGTDDYDTQTQTVYYGDLVEFTIPEEARNNATFSIQYYDDEGNALPATKATYNGETLQRVAKSNMDITVKVSNKAQAEGYKVQIKNIYGTVIDVFYCATLPEPDGTNPLNINGESYPAPVVPFYNFTGWTKSVNEADHTAIYTANYNAGESLTFDFEGIENAKVSGAAATAEGATTYTTAFDTQVTIDGSEVANFYAWATEIKVGGVTKYQIASYSPEYRFYAVTGNGTIDGVTGEKFVPVLKTGTESNYTYTVNNEELTAAKVDSVYYIDADPSILNSDAILKQKLDAKAPFISTISAKMNSDNNAATGYCRIAYDGDIKPSEFGVLARSKATTQQDIENGAMNLGTATKFKSSNILPSGQFIFTINKTNGFTREVLFRGYMYYDFTYNFSSANASASANLNVGETSGYIATTATA